jgi:uncharacterized membrane protein YcfT
MSANVRRTVWADAAKGGCILLVVLWHTVMKHYLRVDWRLPLPIPGAWGTLGELLLPLRMPLFFTISGVFAASAVQRPWRVLGRTKVAKFGYLYALWLLVHTAALALVPDFDTARAGSALELLEQLTITPSNLWYLLALAVYFTVAKAVRRVPTALVLGPALLLSSIAAAGLVATPGNRGGLLQNLVFFLAGLRLRPLVERLATAGWRRTAAFGSAYTMMMVLMVGLGAQRWFGVWPVVSTVAAVFGITAAAQVAKWDRAGRALAALGRRTLPIYVIHMPVLALLHAATVDALSAAGPALQVALAVVEPVAMTALVTAVCLGLHRVLRTTWLFDRPTLGRFQWKRGGHRAQLDPADLAGRGGRVFLDEHDATRTLHRLHALAAEFDKRALVDGAARGQHDVGDRLVEAVGVGDGDDHRLRHRLVGEQPRLDL